MPTLLICSNLHPAAAILTGRFDHVVDLQAPSVPRDADAMVVVIDASGSAEVSAGLEECSGRDGVRVLLVAPGFSPESARYRSVQKLAEQASADVLLHAPLTEMLRVTRNDVASRGELVWTANAGPVPWVAAADLADEVFRWLDGAWSGTVGLAGPETFDGADLAHEISSVLDKTLQPETFVAQRFWEMDADGNGIVENREAIDHVVRLGLARAMAKEIVEAADRDGDGCLDVNEFVHGLWGVLRSALVARHREVNLVTVPEPLLRDRWARAGLTFGEASGQIEHITQGALPSLTRRGRRTVREVLARHALGFVRLHILPGRGLLTRREGRFGEDNPEPPSLLWSGGDSQLMEPSILSQKILPDGRILSGRRAADGGAVELRWIGDGPRDVVRFGAGDAACAIELEGDCLVGLACRGPWPALRDMAEDVIQRRRLRAWEVALFREQGSIRLDHVDLLADPNDVICHCAGVQRSALEAVCSAGTATLEAVARSTGATQVCGGCTPLVKEVIGSARLEFAEILEKTVLKEGIVRVLIAPVRGQPVPSLPGQHIVVQGRIGGRWVTRAYTLTSPGGRSHPYEITVKREEMGVFSRWLADFAGSGTLIRCSEPCGEVRVGPDQVGPVHVFAGGIGITPGMAIARTFAAEAAGRTVHIDWSARTPSDFVFGDELDGLAGAGVTWTQRCTSVEGRLDASIVRRTHGWTDGAMAIVCGPVEYSAEVAEGLAGAGWPASAVHVETFSSNVNDAGEVQPAPVVVRSQSGAMEAIQTDSFFVDLREGRDVLTEAAVFLKQMYQEKGLEGVLSVRLADVRAEVEATGTYTLSRDELAYGAQLAWRNSTRCIGRFFWRHLQVRDMRHLETEEEMFQAVVDHMRLATNGGDLLSAITVFRSEGPTIRLWNDQLIRYAGYRQADGTVVGDPGNCELTARIQALGWKGPGGRFDVLPLVFQIGDRPPRWFALPADVVLEVPLEHPNFPWFAELGLRWYALPAVSSMALDVGGVVFRCVPFNGFYMVTEIGARNLTDASRYNILPLVAEKMGLDCSRSTTMWKDRALVEVNLAVMHSFQKAGVRMLDHHTMSDHFHAFEREEQACGRAVHGDWSWLVPPMSGALSSLFFRADLKNVVLKPMFQYQHPVWDGDRPAPDHEGPIPPCPYHHGAGPHAAGEQGATRPGTAVRPKPQSD